MEIRSEAIVNFKFNIEGVFEHGDHVAQMAFALELKRNEENQYEFIVGLDYDVDGHNETVFNLSFRKHYILDFTDEVTVTKLFPIVQSVYIEALDKIGKIATIFKISRLPAKPPLDKEKIQNNLFIVISKVNNRNDLN